MQKLRARLGFAALAWRVWASVCGILLMLGACVALFFASLHYRLAVGDWTERALFDRSPVVAVVNWAPLFDLALLAALLMCLFFWLRWVYLAAKTVWLVDDTALRHSPMVAVFGFLAPVAQLWMPIFTLVDIEDFATRERRKAFLETAPDEKPDLPLKPGAIVLMALVSLGMIGAVFTFPIDDFSTPMIGQRVMLAVAAASISALVLLVLVDSYIRGVERELRMALERAEAAVETPAA